MLIGHFGVALALKRAEPRLNVGWLCFASLWPDLLLWTLALLGIEQVAIPEQYARLHYLQFVFPYSHSIFAAVMWTAIAYAIGRLVWRGVGAQRVALVLATATASHFLLDLLVHPPDMPLAGESSLHIGLGLWNRLVVALVVEAAILLTGLWYYYRATEGITMLGKYGPVILTGVVGLMALIGQAIAPTPPSVAMVAVQGLGTIILLIALLFWFDADRRSV